MAVPIVLDCDPGHDDAVAILLAVSSPAIDLLAVTTCFGNCPVEDATRNALRVLTLAGGLALGNYVHGKSGLDGPDLPEPAFDPVGEGAVELIARTLREHPEPVTLVVTGPMTNVGHLLRDQPELAERVAEVIFMGG